MAFCKENWECGPWTPEICPVEQFQTRICTDLNNCNTRINKPETVQACIHIASCTDGLLNGEETDIDCGGPQCPACNDGQKCLVGSDCLSGVCDPSFLVCLPPSCFDGVKNDGEEGVDCGGPCPSCGKPVLVFPPEIQAPTLIELCGRSFPWIFALITAVLTTLIYLATKLYIKNLHQNNRRFQRLKRLDQMRRILSIQRRTFYAIASILFINLAVSIYIYYLGGCPQFRELFVWIIALSTAFFTLLFYILLRRLEFNEEKRLIHLKDMLAENEKELKRLYAVQQRQLLDLENIAEGNAEAFVRKYRSFENVMKLYSRIEPGLKAVGRLASLRGSGKSTDSLETQFNDMAKSLKDDEDYAEAIQEYRELKELVNLILRLSDHYDKRRQLFEQLDQNKELLQEVETDLNLAKKPELEHKILKDGKTEDKL